MHFKPPRSFICSKKQRRKRGKLDGGLVERGEGGDRERPETGVGEGGISERRGDQGVRGKRKEGEKEGVSEEGCHDTVLSSILEARGKTETEAD